MNLKTNRRAIHLRHSNVDKVASMSGGWTPIDIKAGKCIFIVLTFFFVFIDGLAEKGKKNTQMMEFF